jgi:hypothetical protein
LIESSILVIEIEENKPLYFYNSDKTIVFEDKNTVLKEEAVDLFRVPRLMNYVPDDKYDGFIKGMSKVKQDVLGNSLFFIQILKNFFNAFLYSMQ